MYSFENVAYAKSLSRDNQVVNYDNNILTQAGCLRKLLFAFRSFINRSIFFVVRASVTVADIDMIVSPLILCFGALFNLYVALYCFQCSRWRSSNNLKYFIVFQTIVNTGNLFAHLVLLLRDELNDFDEIARVGDHTICDILPNITACFMSLSVFNLTAFVVVRYLTNERRWTLSALKIVFTLLGIVVSSGLLLSPALSYLYHQMPVLKCNGCYCPSPGMIWEANFDVWLYGYMVILLQFVIPAIILSTAVLRGLARQLEETRTLRESWYRWRCGLKSTNIVTLAVCLFITFILPVRGIRFVAGEHFFPDSTKRFAEIELLNSVFYILEISWAAITAILPVCLKNLTDDEISGEQKKENNNAGRTMSPQSKTYCEALVELELWE